MEVLITHYYKSKNMIRIKDIIMDGMLKLAKLGIGQLFEAQKAALAD